METTTPPCKNAHFAAAAVVTAVRPTARVNFFPAVRLKVCVRNRNTGLFAETCAVCLGYVEVSLSFKICEGCIDTNEVVGWREQPTYFLTVPTSSACPFFPFYPKDR